MLHIIHRDGLADIDFIKKHVQGYDELVKEVLLDFTPGKAAEICGVSVERMTEFAHAYAKSKAPFIRLGSGLSRYGNGAMTCRAINALSLIHIFDTMYFTMIEKKYLYEILSLLYLYL